MTDSNINSTNPKLSPANPVRRSRSLTLSNPNNRTASDQNTTHDVARIRDETRRCEQLVELLVHERRQIVELSFGYARHLFTCYHCLRRLPLSRLILNDRCRHNVCRECFSKVLTASGATIYECLVCRNAVANRRRYQRPSILVTLSAGYEPSLSKTTEPSSLFGYRVQLIDNW